MTKILYRIALVIIFIFFAQYTYAYDSNPYGIPGKLLLEANNGDPDALYKTAKYYFDASSCEDACATLTCNEEAHVLGMQALKRAAEKGHKEANAHLGWLYYVGADLINIDHKKAIYYSERGAKSGDINSMCTLAGVYQKDGNFKKAFYWYKQATMGEPHNNMDIDCLRSSFFSLGDMYEKGIGTSIDKVNAYAYKKIIIMLDKTWERIIDTKTIYSDMTEAEKRDAERIIYKWRKITDKWRNENKLN